MAAESELAAFGRGMVARRNPQELAWIARVKRFTELQVSDAALRDQLFIAAKGEARTDLDNYSKIAGINLDRVRPLWNRNEACGRFDDDKWPEVAAWQSWVADINSYRLLLRSMGSASSTNPIFKSWRDRQLVRLKTELPPANDRANSYPVIAFELADGCSIGCNFCGLSAERFKGYFPYAPNQHLWREMIGATLQFFGPPAGTALCYWATDPFDNPDYLQFIEDFYNETGVLPQTTTAAPMRNPSLMHRSLELARKCGCGHPRFSLLSNKQLATIHQQFTPDDLLQNVLIPHARGSVTIKARAGHAYQLTTEPGQHATIACVTGFLVNMVHKTVRLVAPCTPTDKWKSGYRIFEESTFSSARDFYDTLCRMRDTHCVRTPDAQQILRFRSDLSYEPTNRGFSLRGAGGTVHVQDHPLTVPLGAAIHRGTMRLMEIINSIDSSPLSAISVSTLVGRLRDQEVLAD